MKYLSGGHKLLNVYTSMLRTFEIAQHNQATLDSGIDVAHGIIVAPGTFGKNIKCSP